MTAAPSPRRAPTTATPSRPEHLTQEPTTSPSSPRRRCEAQAPRPRSASTAPEYPSRDAALAASSFDLDDGQELGAPRMPSTAVPSPVPCVTSPEPRTSASTPPEPLTPSHLRPRPQAHPDAVLRSPSRRPRPRPITPGTTTLRSVLTVRVIAGRLRSPLASLRHCVVLRAAAGHRHFPR
ncbi:extensin-like, partial [Sorghum bicolor]|uniref:extensin-like n=1 Tax=Sorghum bicolor TaxID=4558 RepID=UPI000B4253E0